jgi:hypothetical protein
MMELKKPPKLKQRISCIKVAPDTRPKQDAYIGDVGIGSPVKA